MLRIINVLIVAATITQASSLLSAQTVTVSGRLVDLACYILDKGNTGNAHKGKGKNCARACAAEGFPVGVLTDDGKVYHIVGEFATSSREKLIEHMGTTVTVTGEVKTDGGQLLMAAKDLKEQTGEQRSSK